MAIQWRLWIKDSSKEKACYAFSRWPWSWRNRSVMGWTGNSAASLMLMQADGVFILHGMGQHFSLQNHQKQVGIFPDIRAFGRQLICWPLSILKFSCAGVGLRLPQGPEGA